MKDVRSRSRSMTAFADTHGPPDAETTARMRERLQSKLRDREVDRAKWSTWVKASLVTAVVLGLLGFGAWQMGWLGGGSDSPSRGVITATDRPMELEHDWGEIVLAPHTLVRLGEQDDVTEIELVEGEIELRSHDATAIPMRVRIGAYEVAGESARFAVHRTPGVPLVTVYVGRVQLKGPDLPSSGVVMAAPD